MKIIGKTLGDRVKFARNQRGLTQQELAEKADLPFPTYQSIEYATTRKPNYEIVAAVARALEVSFERLTGLQTIEPQHDEPDNPMNSETISEYVQRLEESAALGEKLRRRHPLKALEFLAAHDVNWRARGPLLSEEWSNDDANLPKKSGKKSASR